ncbi:hypothetical protein GCM10009110_10540 [Psychrobacter piscatorii]
MSRSASWEYRKLYLIEGRTLSVGYSKYNEDVDCWLDKLVAMLKPAVRVDKNMSKK